MFSRMKQMGLFEAKNRFSAVCESVARTGEPLVVTKRGHPVVKIVPCDAAPDSVWSTVEDGIRRYGPLQDEFDLPPRDPAANRTSPL